MNTKNDTFYALSSAPGSAAISVVRISGPRAIQTLTDLTKNKHKKLSHRKSVLVDIYNKNNNLIDRVVAIPHYHPKTYTGENMVEIHTHGNPKIVENLFKELSNMGLRLADPGEFTKTAYLNNKIDLVQAESIFSLINARSDRGLHLSLNNAGGALSTQLKKIKKHLMGCLAAIEYELDVSESGKYKKTLETTSLSIIKIMKLIKTLISSHKQAAILTEGARIVIVGQPNAGKSTLFNALLKFNRAIVTKTPGTTRDTIEGPLYIGNYSTLFVDTAGIRNTTDDIESMGVKKTNEELQCADLVYHVIDITQNEIKTKPITPAPIITILNKSDLVSPETKNKISKEQKNSVIISAKKSRGIKKLKDKTKTFLGSQVSLAEPFYLTSNRQKEALLKVYSALEKTQRVDVALELELVAHNIKNAVDQFDWLLGKTTPEEILKNVFSEFCVGK